MRDRPLFIPGISGAGEKATQQVQSLKAGVLAQGKPSEISSYGLFCAPLSSRSHLGYVSPLICGTGLDRTSRPGESRFSGILLDDVEVAVKGSRNMLSVS